MLPIFYISYHYTQDHNRSRLFKLKYQNLSKVFPEKLHCLNVYESSSDPKSFKGNGIPALKDNMITDAHNEVIKRATKLGYNEVLIIEDKTTFINQTEFKNFIINFKTSIPNPNWTILFLGGYIENHELPSKNQTWVKGKSRSHFAYVVNLKNINTKNINTKNINNLNEDLGQYLYNLDNTYYHHPFLVIPQYYDYKKGLMGVTAKGLSMAQIEESSDLSELKLKMDFVEQDTLPSVTLLTVLDNSRTWWPMISMNLNNLDYSTKKMEWIILDLSLNPLDLIEDLLPKKRGKEGGWHLKYIKNSDWNGLDFIDLVEKLKDQITHSYVVELDPKTFYPTFSIYSRIKTAIKYPDYGYFGSTEIQMYNIPKDCTYIIGNNESLEFLEGTRLVCLERNIKNKMRIPGQFVSRMMTYVDKNDQVMYKGMDKFPDYLEHESFFSDLILIIDDLRKEYQKRGAI